MMLVFRGPHGYVSTRRLPRHLIHMVHVGEDVVTPTRLFCGDQYDLTDFDVIDDGHARFVRKDW